MPVRSFASLRMTGDPDWLTWRSRLSSCPGRPCSQRLAVSGHPEGAHLHGDGRILRRERRAVQHRTAPGRGIRRALRHPHRQHDPDRPRRGSGQSGPVHRESVRAAGKPQERPGTAVGHLRRARLQFNLSGGKSWHRIAPFVGAGVGLAFAKATPADTSQYEFGRKFYLAPSVGFRFFITDRLHLRGGGPGHLLEAELSDHI